MNAELGRKYSVAERLIQHRARTKLVNAITGVTEYEIKQLYAKIHNEAPKRGSSTSSLLFFFKSAAVKIETTLLAQCIKSQGLFNSDVDTFSLEFGELICEAFEMYSMMTDNHLLDFERCLVLINALHKKSIVLQECEHCKTHFTLAYEHATKHNCTCPFCQAKTVNNRANYRMRTTGHVVL
jgi:hypothetical protein